MFRPFFVLIVLGMLCAVAVPGARADDTTPPAAPTITWVAPSPISGSVTTVEAGTPVTISVAASDSDPAGVVHIAAVGPDGATIAAKDGNPATATVTWTPTADQAGSSTITFTATDAATPPNAAPPLVVTYNVEAPPPPPPPAPVVTPLTDLKISHWAFVLRNVDAHSAPDASSKVVAHISTKTGDGTSNLLLLLEQRKTASGIWVKARLAILPNGSVGWVPRSALSEYKLLHTHLYIDRGLKLLALQRDGKVIFRTHVGVGKTYWPTPQGQFYIRDKLINFANPFYGPIAFGTSARSAVLTDWPGGGYVGVHGTNEPSLIPGQISHGCVRLRNQDIERLASLMAVGTPLTVT